MLTFYIIYEKLNNVLMPILLMGISGPYLWQPGPEPIPGFGPG